MPQHAASLTLAQRAFVIRVARRGAAIAHERQNSPSPCAPLRVIRLRFTRHARAEIRSRLRDA
jgi:hypothetical protein